MEQWKNKTIQDDGSAVSEEFIEFIGDLRQYLEKELNRVGLELHTYSPNHYDISGFVFNREHKKYGYFSLSDVRYTTDWARVILVRSAKHEKDYTGGRNRYTGFDDLIEILVRITNGENENE